MRAVLAQSRITSRRAQLSLGAIGIALILSAAPPAHAQTYPPGTTVTTTTRTIAPYAPPEVRTEVIPAAPSDLVVWHPGHWQWTGDNWAWDPGHYVTRPQATAMWEPGHWAPEPAGGFLWVEGHWN